MPPAEIRTLPAVALALPLGLLREEWLGAPNARPEGAEPLSTGSRRGRLKSPSPGKSRSEC